MIQMTMFIYGFIFIIDDRIIMRICTKLLTETSSISHTLVQHTAQSPRAYHLLYTQGVNSETRVNLYPSISHTLVQHTAQSPRAYHLLYTQGVNSETRVNLY
eukprot:808472_1